MLREVRATHGGWVRRVATRDIGLLVIELGGGRRVASDTIDHRVGLSEVVGLGQRVAAGDRLAMVHAADAASADRAAAQLALLLEIGDEAPASPGPLLTALEG